ncbi:MAG: HIT family hydrolase [Nitrospinae bacterium RIFCSPLOWO2_02_FULL_39_110]|nr:MAG: HIT family hydrolase [Nitrospinae bacterium RIFCSPHIGHO2_12_FULL_39_42]OGW01131.1 MAG: HIT family hydrolase [Nitrospinae bacterium RIFCSPHIGHO2_02_FULL_39_82]OGW04812.1 MAG: HIT family hydrolase [Nitrospinae bacterium RIFCSPLOWO2_02_FULL_39_110]OGW06860.1 MAG: HIT family hydrolase [Nitrospinae bacterium RIFCSPLOWO2_02_39_17]OGW10135.1 MAG: HIT family hydrolase [Nitrospinae bacterium RIFCSPLOWO2_12_FULL_39_93]OGW11232.1 MAG: HIT family hydrolase [Nitrospinae bacterium RIFCSPLOWO2_12_39_
MKTLWAPWRMSYFQTPQKNSCIFCDKPKESADKENYILYRGKSSFVIMNIYPYNNAHLMVSPYKHIPSLSKLQREDLIDLTLLTQTSLQILENAFRAEGFNVGINIGKAAGAGFADHVHIHIVPRWNSDTNFMPVLSETRVMPEHLNSTYEKLIPYFKDVQL